MTLAPETRKRSRLGAGGWRPGAKGGHWGRGAGGWTLAGERDPGSGLLSLPAKGTCLFPQDRSFYLTQTTEQQ